MILSIARLLPPENQTVAYCLAALSRISFEIYFDSTPTMTRAGSTMIAILTVTQNVAGAL